MRRYIIERKIPGVGGLNADGLRSAAKKSNQALAEVGDGVRWQESFVTADGTYCVYLAENEDLIREHAARSGFPANRIVEVKTIIDPSTGRA